MSILESFATCQVTPEPHTIDHLVLQLVQGGLQHAPVQSIATLLQLLADTDYNPGPLFMKNYAYVSVACAMLVFFYRVLTIYSVIFIVDDASAVSLHVCQCQR